MNNQTQEALKMAIEDAMKFVVTLNNYEDAIQSKPFKNDADRYLSYASVVIKSLATSLKEALEQQAQKPVAYADYERGTCYLIGTPIPKDEIANPLYTHPHQWQGLKDDEIVQIAMGKGYANRYELCISFSRAIEQALKEKNYG